LPRTGSLLRGVTRERAAAAHAKVTEAARAVEAAIRSGAWHAGGCGKGDGRRQPRPEEHGGCRGRARSVAIGRDGSGT
jgi:hypothetical protein